jgi:single-strand DNA-binding protein
MANLNKVMLIGNLTRDPELRYTPSGTAVADFGLAVNRKFKDQEETTFVDCVVWARQAEVLTEYMKKGRPIFIEGRLTYDQWEDRRTGDKRSKLKVTVENFQFLGSRGDDGGGRAARSERRPPRAQQPAEEERYELDEDIPF